MTQYRLVVEYMPTGKPIAVRTLQKYIHREVTCEAELNNSYDAGDEPIGIVGNQFYFRRGDSFGKVILRFVPTNCRVYFALIGGTKLYEFPRTLARR